jgi:hypothetical protein
VCSPRDTHTIITTCADDDSGPWFMLQFEKVTFPKSAKVVSRSLLPTCIAGLSTMNSAVSSDARLNGTCTVRSASVVELRTTSIRHIELNGPNLVFAYTFPCAKITHERKQNDICRSKELSSEKIKNAIGSGQVTILAYFHS